MRTMHIVEVSDLVSIGETGHCSCYWPLERTTPVICTKTEMLKLVKGEDPRIADFIRKNSKNAN